MKALQSELARDVLADPAAMAQLRRYLASRSAPAADEGADPRGVVIEVNSKGRNLRLTPVVVPKAA